MSLMAACYTENLDMAGGSAAKGGAMSQMTADQSRVVRYSPAQAGATRTVDNSTALPVEASPTVQALRDRGVQEYDPNQSNNGGEWLITGATKDSELRPTCWNGEVTLYVARSDIKLWLSGNGNLGRINGHVYILERDENGDYVENVQLPTYWPEGAASLAEGWELKVWGKIKTDVAFVMCKYTEFRYYGTDVLEINNFSTQTPDGFCRFYGYGPVRFTGDTNVSTGDYTFYGSVTYDNLNIDNKPSTFIFNDCARIHKLKIAGNESVNHFYINYLLEITDGVVFYNGSHSVFHLNNSVLTLCGEAERNNSGKNVFINGHYVEAEGNSAIFIQGSVTGEMPSLGNRMFRFFKTKEGEGNKLAVFGRRYMSDSQELITEEPVIYVGWASGAGDNWDDPQCYKSEGYDTDFGSESVTARPTDLDDDFVICANSPYDCRATYVWGTQPSIQDEILPPAKHKYSATGLAFDGNYVYICWHSNLPGGEMQGEGDDSFFHDHGTNMDGERSDAGYGGPSVESDKDWGGIIDIVQIDNYHPDNANLYISGTWWNPEHKYNHVKYHGGNLYLASTSRNVGAALHVVPLLPSESGVGQTFDSKNAYRVNLTGMSANCVEVVDDKYLATVSGRSVGGLNWFPLGETANQEAKNINGETTDYGGKYICDDGDYIYVLHNTSDATVTRYDRKGNPAGEHRTGMSLVPYDGKNAMTVKDGKVYICCGSNGLYVFDWSTGATVGRSRLAANCADVDDNGYIYVATGGGLAVYHVDNRNADTGEYNTINYVAYTGKGFVYPNGWEEDGTMPDGTAKCSSNFVHVRGSKVFVAYGMYGLRIYTAAELQNPQR